MKINFRQKNKGFTLVEALVSIGVLVMAVTGAMTAAQSGISSSIFSKNQIVAFYLAGEAVEQIRNKRDENGLYNNLNPNNQINWLNGIAEKSTDPCYSDSFTTNVCKVDAITGYITKCDNGICPNLKMDQVSGFYGYSDSYTGQTVYNRQIRMTKINDNEWAISVIVDWSKGISTRKFEIKENIMNWQ